uniref:Interleukin-12 subunit alpha n=1 Tax=Nannospalax galili TaxID=1026970 RepID=A0A8C6R0Z2_NANGA
GVSIPTASPAAPTARVQQPTQSLLLVTLVLLNHLSLARNLPTPVSRSAQCFNHSQKLLRTVNHMLGKARQILKHYSCTAEEIDHEDITKDKTSTLQACLPLELVKNESCLASRETSFKTVSKQTKGSIYEDLKMYQMEFKAMNTELVKDNPRQIILDENMLAAIDEMMRALNFNDETLPQNPALEELDSYKLKMKLCILLHAFSIRTVTISRVMSYLNSS